MGRGDIANSVNRFNRWLTDTYRRYDSLTNSTQNLPTNSHNTCLEPQNLVLSFTLEQEFHKRAMDTRNDCESLNIVFIFITKRPPIWALKPNSKAFKAIVCYKTKKQ